ncbi:MAG: NAD-dependent epimerase/dehydratase family protein [Bacteroidota bacterium]|nr:NAD-dependent epimerase/dehydratase family protein [Bacteroidota bacterium]
MINSKLTNKKILVTGGAGFIGSNLCDKLLDLGAKVVSLDNYMTGNINNLKYALENENFENIKGDIRDYDTCLMATKDVDFVLHNAALGSVPRSIEDPVLTDAINICGFVNILKASIDNNVSRFIYAASSSTYGDSNELPKEESKIGKPLSPYALTKYVNELYAELFNKIYKIEVIGLRYFNVYGRRQSINGPYAAVIPKFIDQLLNYKSPVINGDGSYSRDFTHVDNVTQINILALLTKNKNSVNQIYNTAVGESSSILDLFFAIRKNLSEYDKKINKINVVFGDPVLGDIPHSLASIEKAKKLLNYNPTINLESGIKRTVNWFYNNR